MSDAAPQLDDVAEAHDAPGISPDTQRAFEAWRRDHPAAPSAWRTEHSEWMAFLAHHQLELLRARAAIGAAPPATSTTPTEREP